MPMSVSLTYVKADGNTPIRVGFNLVISGTYVTGVGGDTIDFTKAVQDALFQGLVAYIDSSLPLISLDIWDVSGNIADTYFPVLGTAQNNCKLKICSAFNTELGSGAYPATIKLVGEACFVKNV